MRLENYTIRNVSPTVSDFIALRSAIGWGTLAVEVAKASLMNSLFHVTIYQDKTLIAMGRVVGDGAMYFYVQDVIVAPNYQGLGIGKLLMIEIENYLTETATQGATVGLLAAKGKEAFYQQFDYIQRPNDILGHGMCKFIT